jgi:hypothetical protein
VTRENEQKPQLQLVRESRFSCQRRKPFGPCPTDPEPLLSLVSGGLSFGIAAGAFNLIFFCGQPLITFVAKGVSSAAT